MVKEEHHSSLLKSLEKSLDVLDLFVECNTGMTLKEIAEHTHLNTSTAFRIVNTLERRQYLTRNDTSKQYRLGPRRPGAGLFVSLDGKRHHPGQAVFTAFTAVV